MIIQVDAVNLNESVCKPKSEYSDNASAYRSLRKMRMSWHI